jgi:2,4-dienoyl-CoA reductase-like NADH-dependent reductase (Old Yellow Enzyme family)
MIDPFSPLSFSSGATLKNRFVLAPLTNSQSQEDGVLSEEEFRWLTMRAQGGFALTMTCAAHVDARGKGFPGQLGVFADAHLPGLSRLSGEIKRHGSLAIAQLHHAGIRSPKDLIGGEAPLGPSVDDETGARAMTLDEVHAARDAFIAAAARCERAGFDGVELHGAHNYLICAFLSAQYNRRDDAYGGSPENRARLLFEIIDGVRAQTRRGFTLGVRLSPERFGLQLDEIVAVAARLLRDGAIDFLDMSLWDFTKEPADEAFKGKSLAAYFTALPRGAVRLGAAGKINTGAGVQHCLDMGFDFAVIGRGAILHHDFPRRVAANRAFLPVALPVSATHLRNEGLSPVFVEYMRNWKGFVAAE